VFLLLQCPQLASLNGTLVPESLHHLPIPVACASITVLRYRYRCKPVSPFPSDARSPTMQALQDPPFDATSSVPLLPHPLPSPPHPLRTPQPSTQHAPYPQGQVLVSPVCCMQALHPLRVSTQAPGPGGGARRVSHRTDAGGLANRWLYNCPPLPLTW
jgi:hypothetical protein